MSDEHYKRLGVWFWLQIGLMACAAWVVAGIAARIIMLFFWTGWNMTDRAVLWLVLFFA